MTAAETFMIKRGPTGFFCVVDKRTGAVVSEHRTKKQARANLVRVVIERHKAEEKIEAKRQAFIAALDADFQARIASGELYVDVDETHPDLLCSIHVKE